MHVFKYLNEFLCIYWKSFGAAGEKIYDVKIPLSAGADKGNVHKLLRRYSQLDYLLAVVGRFAM